MNNSQGFYYYYYYYYYYLFILFFFGGGGGVGGVGMGNEVMCWLLTKSTGWLLLGMRNAYVP